MKNYGKMFEFVWVGNGNLSIRCDFKTKLIIRLLISIFFFFNIHMLKNYHNDPQRLITVSFIK